MKHIFKIFILTAFISLLNACTNDKESFSSNNGLTASVVTTVVTPSVLTDATKTNNFAKITWTITDNGVPSESTYILQITDTDADPNFAKPLDYTGTGITVTPQRAAVLTVDEMNGLMNMLPSFKCTEMNIGIRIKSTLGVNKTSSLIQYSNVIKYKVTGYSKSIPLLAFSSTTTNLENASTLKSGSFDNLSNFEGYFYLQAGNFNFYKADGCGSYSASVVYGGTGTALTTGGPAINVPTTGYYYIKADLVANTFSLRQYTSFGIFGPATRNGLGTNSFCPMTDTTNKNIWTATIDLIPGRKFKIKSGLWSGSLTVPPPTPVVPATNPPTTIQNPSFVPNANLTTLNIFGKSLNPGELVYEDTTSAITIASSDITATGAYVNDYTRQSYTLTVDMSKPRAYTYMLKAN